MYLSLLSRQPWGAHTDELIHGPAAVKLVQSHTCKGHCGQGCNSRGGRGGSDRGEWGVIWGKCKCRPYHWTCWRRLTGRSKWRCKGGECEVGWGTGGPWSSRERQRGRQQGMWGRNPGAGSKQGWPASRKWGFSERERQRGMCMGRRGAGSEQGGLGVGNRGIGEGGDRAGGEDGGVCTRCRGGDCCRCSRRGCCERCARGL